MRTLDPERDSLSELLEEVRYTLYRLRRSKAAVTLLPGWEALFKDLRTAFDKEWKLLDNALDAVAGLDCADADLDTMVMSVVHTVLKVVGGDRNHPLYKRYLGSQTPSELIRPRLGEELATVEPWIASLKTAADKELQDLSPGLAVAVLKGRDATTTLAEAQRQLDDFRAGERQKLFGLINAERKTLLGELLRIEQADKLKLLPRDYAERHFRTRRKRAGAVETVATAKLAVAEAQAAHAAAEANLKALLAQEEAERQAAAQREADRKALAETERVIQEAQVRAAELQRRIEGK